MLASSIKTIAWPDVRKQVQALDAELYAAMDALADDDSYQLFEVRYPYGEYVIDRHGNFQLPNAQGPIACGKRFST